MENKNAALSSQKLRDLIPMPKSWVHEFRNKGTGVGVL